MSERRTRPVRRNGAGSSSSTSRGRAQDARGGSRRDETTSDDRPRRPRPTHGRPTDGRSATRRRFTEDESTPRRKGTDEEREPRRRYRDDERPQRSRSRDDDRSTRNRYRDTDRPQRSRSRDDDRSPRKRYDSDDRAPRKRYDKSDGPRSRRRDDDRAPRKRYDSDDRAPRKRFESDERPRRGKSTDRKGPARGRGRNEERPARRRFAEDDRPQTAARRRSAEVRERTGGRRTELQMSTTPVRSQEEWVDEGSVRPKRGAPHKPTGARARTSQKPARGGRRQVRAMDSVIEEIERAVGVKASSRVLRRYEAALASFEAHRYSEARVVLVPLARECADVAAIRELLGLCYYREANWKKAVENLEASLVINPKWIFNHAVLADCHRALGNYARVEELWEEISEASPHPELLAEARIVYAMSIADQGDTTKALGIMVKTVTQPKRIAEYHLRQWYVVADLYDRAGNIIKAREMFEKISDFDPSFADVAERLSVLGH